ncbi:MAG: NADH-quinone oxidoreductase subunit D [Acidobacteria bacterium]|nr:NADH-quinone oxidoreductase subunit D [Acidobacteriota bacterium]NIM64322.1 NADH-quinone oxidoreductase subunit D [Acidobacteriota bacterium]NIQ84965.1 NADH-quinone oxidoreductase subunit D [Acidobacteriota bacterium]NIT10779.1 NADH-quinone oxidoreductase subunit D [Acidobacteriota bacterium]
MDATFQRSPEDPDIVTVNMGPSHPATHGVLRLVLKLDGERVRECVPHLGYLHRGMEKIAENRTYLQFIPYTDRMDYLSPLAANVGIVLAIEQLLDLEVPERCSAIRVICCELARLGSHLLWLGTHALDLGAATVFFHTFKDREWHYDLVEDLTGARLTTSFTRVGGMMHDVDKKWLGRLREFIDAMPGRVDEFESLLTTNGIWLKRTQGVGAITREDAIAFGMTGPSLRAAGEPYDVRKQRPYCGYENYEFEVPTGSEGDIYDRYLVRLEEMRQSVRILRQVLDNLPDGPVNVDDPKIFLPAKKRVLTRMEELIHQFMIVTEGFECPAGEVYHSTEVPKGELGFYIVSTGERSPYRLRIRSPSFNNLATLPHLVEGGLVADVVANIASLDPVMGEVDR